MIVFSVMFFGDKLPPLAFLRRLRNPDLSSEFHCSTGPVPHLFRCHCWIRVHKPDNWFSVSSAHSGTVILPEFRDSQVTDLLHMGELGLWFHSFLAKDNEEDTKQSFPTGSPDLIRASRRENTMLDGL